MSRLLLVGLLAMSAITAWSLLHPSSPAPPAPPPASRTETATRGFALVELFTSEGCSSCPPADRLLAQMAASTRADGTPLYTLSFHVDYWNYLGWTDPYSQAAFSARQRAYSRALGEGVYTPQMIVNGRHAFVGSDVSAAQKALEKVLQEPSTATLALGTSPVTAEGILLVSYTAPDLPADAVVNLAVVERGLSQQVTRGENTGRTLAHENVVRVFETVEAPRGKITLSLPDNLSLSNAMLIGYVQDTLTMRVLGAASVTLR